MRAAAMLLALFAANAQAATAYVTDELVLGVYAEQTTQGQRLATLHSGAPVETLAVSGESTQVRLPDGRTGWVKTAYLTDREPATVRLKQLQDDLDRSRATPPALAEAALRSEVARLTRELAARQADSGTSGTGGPGMATPSKTDADPAAVGSKEAGSGTAPFTAHLWVWIAAICVSLACGFWVGYAVLAHRIREKFGGLKVY